MTIIKAPGLAPQPVKVFKVDGVPVTMDQIIVYACVVVIVVVGALDPALHATSACGCEPWSTPRP